jgi:hypothetical protein
MDLPAIITKLNDEDRKKCFNNIKRKIWENRWIGGLEKIRKDGSGGRPVYRYSNRAVTKTMVRVNPAHVVLVKQGLLPTEDRNVASHLCHDPICLDPNHLEWSPSSDNNRRERKCRLVGSCNCGLPQKCLFNKHK